MAADPSTHGELDATLLEAFADMERRLQAGQSWDAHAFLADHPDVADDPERAADLILHEYFLRRRLGESREPQAWFGRFPRWEELLHHRLQSLQTVSGASARLDHDALTEDHVAAPASAPDGAIPELGRHELHEELGRGGMGVVYRAEDLILNRPVALKMIVPRQGLLETPEAVQRFYKEARAAARLRHPNIIPIHGMGLHQGRHCFTMPLLTGGSLAARKGDCRKDARIAAALVEKIARAVQYAHEQGIIHRDLKPANILLDEHGEPVVADFGLAKVLDGDADASIAGQRVGTPAYMSPEQAAGHTWEVSARSDVWALGVILYELLTDKRPFPDPTPEGIYKQVLTGQPTLPRAHRGDLPADLEEIILKCLQKDPTRRYGAAGEMADDLARWLRGEPIRNEAAPAQHRPAAAPRRRLRRILVVLAAAFVLAGLAAALSWYFFNPDRPLWQAQSQLSSGRPAELIGPTGSPRWSRWLIGAPSGVALVESDGSFSIHGWTLTLRELLPDTRGHSHYLIHAEIRHLTSQDVGFAGVYFAQTTYAGRKGPVHSFLLVTFNDLHDAAEHYNHIPPQFRSGPPPAANPVNVTSYFYGEGEQPNPNLPCEYLHPPLFKPSGNALRPGDWRTLEVEVSPEQIQLNWNGQPVEPVLDPRQVDRQDRERLEQERKRGPDNPALAGFNPQLNLAGGMGLCVNGSSAAFRNVRIVPLDGPGGAP